MPEPATPCGRRPTSPKAAMRTLAELVPLRTAPCREAESVIVAMAAGEVDIVPSGIAGTAAAGHVATCLRCQAEVAAYRRVMTVMRSMRADRLPGLSGAPGEVLLGLHSATAAGGGLDGAPAWMVRAAYVGGLTAAGAAGILVWFNRRRPALAQAG